MMPFKAVNSVVMALLGLSMVFLSSGCEIHATQSGDHGRLNFFYTPSDHNLDFARPLAVGTNMMLFVEGARSESVHDILSVSISNPEVLGAHLSSSDRTGIILQGRREGTARLTVTAAVSGGTITDYTEIHVSHIHEMSLFHTCTDQTNAAYLIGEPIFLEMERRSRHGESLIGTSRHCPALIEPYQFPDTQCDESGMYLPAVEEYGAIRITADAPFRRGSNRYDQLGVHIIDSNLIDFPPIAENLRTGSTRTVQLEPTRFTPEGYAWPICADFDLWVSILTPDTCEGPRGALDFTIPASEQHRFSLRGNRRGDCFFDVSLPEFGNHIIWEFSNRVEGR